MGELLTAGKNGELTPDQEFAFKLFTILEGMDEEGQLFVHLIVTAIFGLTEDSSTSKILETLANAILAEEWRDKLNMVATMSAIAKGRKQVGDDTMEAMLKDLISSN